MNNGPCAPNATPMHIQGAVETGYDMLCCVLHMAVHCLLRCVRVKHPIKLATDVVRMVLDVDLLPRHNTPTVSTKVWPLCCSRHECTHDWHQQPTHSFSLGMNNNVRGQLAPDQRSNANEHTNGLSAVSLCRSHGVRRNCRTQSLTQTQDDLVRPTTRSCCLEASIDGG